MKYFTVGGVVFWFLSVGVLLSTLELAKSETELGTEDETHKQGWSWFKNGGGVTGWTATNFPNPMTQSNLCGRRGVKSQVCDPDAILSYESANVVEDTLNTIIDQTGAQVAVAVMKRMGGGLEGESGAERLARGLHDQWGVGDMQRNDGVLLLLAVENRQVYISTGRGVKSLLNDRKLDQVIDRMKIQLRIQQYDEAVEQAVRDLGNVLAGASLEIMNLVEDEEGADAWTIMGFLGLFGLGAGACVWHERKADRNYKRCVRHLESLQEARKRALNKTYAATSCPICLEDFPPEEEKEAGPEKSESVHPADASHPETPPVPSGASSSSFPTPSTPPLPEDFNSSRDTKSTSKATPFAPASTHTSASNPISDSRGTHAPTQASPEARPKKEEADPQKAPTCLPCGHVFCLGCITEWMRKEAARAPKCPVCRRSIDDAPSPAPRPGPPPSQPPPPGPPPGCNSQAPPPPRPAGWGRHPQDYQGFHPEFIFRMAQLHRRYPSYVTRPILQRWTDPMYDPDARLGFVNDQEFTRLSPEARRQAAARGSHGSSRSSFGGGSSGGGGGRGGSW